MLLARKRPSSTPRGLQPLGHPARPACSGIRVDAGTGPAPAPDCAAALDASGERSTLELVPADSLTVTTTPAGQPLRLIWRGHTWRVAARPVRYYKRRAWWAEEARAAKGARAGLVDTEVWRLQVQLGTRGELRTIEAIRDQVTGRWYTEEPAAQAS